MSRGQFGKVPTPVTVVDSRMAMFVGKIAHLDRKLELPEETAIVAREQVAHISVCRLLQSQHQLG